MRQSHDFPPTIFSAKNRANGQADADPLGGGPSITDAMSHNMRQSLDATSGNMDGAVGPLFEGVQRK